MTQRTTIVEKSLERLKMEEDRLTKEGWVRDPAIPLSAFLFSYELGMMRDPTPEQVAKENKPSRAEILAKARAAKAEKNKEGV